ncbi:MAG: hypothetical protein Kow0013_13160 [Pararhodobacter sp.]
MKRLALIAALTLASPALADEATLDAMAEYLAFAAPIEGVILPEQIDQTVFEAATFIDARSAEEFTTGSIPGAINIDWREVLERIDEIPADGMVILFCNTGIRSAQATFALRVAGRTNAVVLQSGLDGWQANAAYRP